MLDDPWRTQAAWREKGALVDGVSKAFTSDKGAIFDIIVVGSGAGGAMAARQLAMAGAKVAMLEAGGLYTAKDFNGSESLYLDLYKNGLLNSTVDGSVNLLQGRCVGGSATVNWTSSFRMPHQTLAHWQSEFGASRLSAQRLAAEFDFVESLLSVYPWAGTPNYNNQVLAAGAQALGWQHGVIPRNVKGCLDLGFCGLGCPINAKQSPLITTVPQAINAGATLIYNAGVSRLLHDGDRAYGVVLDDGKQLFGRHITLAAGAVNSPGILMRSGLNKVMPMIGKRTFLHPSCFSLARFDQEVNPFYGAPQSMYSDEFLWHSGKAEGSALMGFKLEAVPLQPVLASGIFAQNGQALARDMSKLGNTHGMTSLIRDGFDGDEGGHVVLSQEGNARLNYPQSKKLIASAKRALVRMAECQFAAGANEVRPAHLLAREWFSDIESLRSFIESAAFDQYHLSLGSAHLMGGCGIGRSVEHGVVDDFGQALALNGLSVADASVFPTSLGVNPQLTIMAMSSIISDQVLNNI